MQKVKSFLVSAIIFLSLSPLLSSAQGFYFTSEDVRNSPITKTAEFYILGLRDISDLPSPWDYWTIIIIFMMVWLIIAAAFSDILIVFSPFSRRPSILIGIAMTLIAANLRLVQIISIWLIQWVSLFGVISVFVGIASAFAAFLAISIGFEPVARWALNRKARMYAHKGQADIASGIQVFAKAGREARRAGGEHVSRVHQGYSNN